MVVERDGVEVDWCLSCHGIWFDADELELLAEKAGRDLRPAVLGHAPADKVTEQSRRCPRCRRKMAKVEVPGGSKVIVDRCAEHGVWFDAGELGAVMSELAGDDESIGHVVRFLGETFRQSAAANGRAEP